MYECVPVHGFNFGESLEEQYSNGCEALHLSLLVGHLNRACHDVVEHDRGHPHLDVLVRAGQQVGEARDHGITGLHQSHEAYIMEE